MSSKFFSSEKLTIVESPTVGQLEYGQSAYYSIVTIYQQYAEELGEPIDPLEYNQLPKGGRNSPIKYGKVQRFQKDGQLSGVITLDRRNRASVIIGTLFEFFNQVENNCFDKFGGYPISEPYHIDGHSILEFPQGDLVLTADNHIFQIFGEMGAEFFARGAYTYFGFPKANEIWSIDDQDYPTCTQQFEKCTLIYSHNPKGTFFVE